MKSNLNLKQALVGTAVAALSLLSNTAKADIPLGHFSGTVTDVANRITVNTDVVTAVTEDADHMPLYYGVAIMQWDSSTRESKRTTIFKITESTTGTLFFKTLRVGPTGGLEESSGNTGLLEGVLSYYKRRTRLTMSDVAHQVQFNLKLKKNTRIAFTNPTNLGRRYLPVGSSRRAPPFIVNSHIARGNLQIGTESATGQYQLEPVFPGIYLMRKMQVETVDTMNQVLETAPSYAAVFLDLERPLRRDRDAMYVTRVQENTEVSGTADRADRNNRNAIHDAQLFQSQDYLRTFR